MATALASTHTDNALQALVIRKDFEQSEKAGIMHFINSIFKKQKETTRPHQKNNPEVNPEFIYRMSCEKFKTRSSLLDKTLIINSVQNHLGLRAVKKRKQAGLLKINTCKSSTTSTSSTCNDEDVPLGVLRLKN